MTKQTLTNAEKYTFPQTLFQGAVKHIWLPKSVFGSDDCQSAFLQYVTLFCCSPRFTRIGRYQQFSAETPLQTLDS